MVNSTAAARRGKEWPAAERYEPRNTSMLRFDAPL